MGIFLRGLRWLGLLVLVLVIGLVLAVPIDGYVNRKTVERLTNQVISQGESNVKAFVAMPDVDEPLPAIIMIHEFWGLKQSIVGKAEALANEGYVVVAPDTFRESNASWLPRAIWQTLTVDRDEVNADLDAVFSWLASRPEVDPTRIMVMGFCYGGGTSLQYSLQNDDVAATGIFYGSLITDANDLRNLPGPVLGIFGEEDNSIPLADVNAFEAALKLANVPNEIHIFENQGHAFVKDIEGIASGGAQGEAWQEFLEFSANVLKGS